MSESQPEQIDAAAEEHQPESETSEDTATVYAKDGEPESTPADVSTDAP